MRTAKCLIIVLVLAAAASAADPAVSNTRTADCLVRITADSDIVPLNAQTVNHLVLSSAVAGKAAQDALGLQGVAVREVIHEGIQVEWLSQSIHAIGQPALGRARSTVQPTDEEYEQMMQQLQEIYGDRLMRTSEPSEKQDTGQEPPAPAEPGQSRSSRSSEGPERGTNSRLDARGMTMGGGMGMGGMGGRGMGMGGMTMGGMGTGSTGMGGMMGGRMGRGMMGGMGGMYGGPAPSAAGLQQTATLKLSVDLPEDVNPMAAEFLSALVKNLRQALLRACNAYTEELTTAVVYAERRRDEAKENLDMAMGLRSPEARFIQERLEQIVDLSVLTPTMLFGEAIEAIKNAVEPPLPIVVMWKELLDSCQIEPTTPIDMDGPPQVKLETALRALLEAVGGTHGDISYQLDNDVIIIREEDSQKPQAVPAAPGLEVDLRELVAERRSLARELQRLEMDLATTEAREMAIEEQMLRVRAETERKMKEDAVAGEMQKLVDLTQDRVSRLRKLGAGADELAQPQEDLVQAKISLARRREELSSLVGGGQLKEFNSELSRMVIDSVEKKAHMDLIRRQLAEVEVKVARASVFDPKAAQIQTAREALDMAEAQVSRLKTRLASLLPSTVTVIGGN